MAHSLTCPSEAELRDLLLGRGTDAQSEHLLNCPHCGANAGRLVSRDPLLSDLRVANDTSELGSDGTFVEELLRRVKVKSAASTVSENELSFLDPPLAVHPGDLGQFDRYRIVEQIGQGGMGMVFRAIDPTLERTVALKIIIPKYASNQKLRDRFLEEARATVKVRSPHVAEVYDCGVWKDVPYLTMELLVGTTLDNKPRPMALDSWRRIGYSIAKGLADAHRAGMIHRDLKPSNIHLGTDQRTGKPTIKLIDFGLARPVDRAIEVTKSGELLGTPAYMSPEQARGKKVDHRTDLYSLGVILHQLATGKLPYDAADQGVMAILTELAVPEPLTSISQRTSKVPAKLAKLIDQLLAKNPDDRPASAADVMKVLRESVNAKADAKSGSGTEVVESAPYVSISEATGSYHPEAQVSTPFGEMATSPLTAEAAPGLATPAPPRRPGWLWPAVGLGTVLAALLIALGLGAFRVKTKDGIIELTDLPEDAEVFVDGNVVTVTWDDGDETAEISVPAGTRKVEVKVNNVVVSGETVEVAVGERKPITVQYESIEKPDAPLAVPPVVAQGQVESEELVANGDFDTPVRLSWVIDSGRWHQKGTAPNAILCAGECRFGQLHQNIDVSKYGKEIDKGRVKFKVSCLLSSFDADRSRLQLTFHDQDDKHLSIGYDTGEKAHRMKWVEYGDTVTPPIGTRKARITLRSTLTPRPGNKENSGYYDKISLKALIEPVKMSDGRNPTTIQGGQWVISGNVLKHTTAATPACLFFGDPQWAEYDFSVEMKTEGSASVFFRVQSLEKKTQAFLRQAERNRDLTAVEIESHDPDDGKGFKNNPDGFKHEVYDHPISKINRTDWYTVKVRVRNQQVTVTVNDKDTVRYGPPRHSSGRVGLRSWGGASEFRNIRVTDPNGNKLFEGFPNLDTEVFVASDRLSPGSVWIGNRIYEKGIYSPSTVPYELHIVTRDGAKFSGHCFDNGTGRNRAEVEGEIVGTAMKWTERPRHNPEFHYESVATITDKAISGTQISHHRNRKTGETSIKIILSDTPTKTEKGKPVELPPVVPTSPAPASPAVPGLDPKMTALFNGKDLTGWEQLGSDGNTWIVENGELVGSVPSKNANDANEPGTKKLATTKDYRHFHMRMQVYLPDQEDRRRANRIVFLPDPSTQRGNGYFKLTVGSSTDEKNSDVVQLLRGAAELLPTLAQPKIESKSWYTLEIIMQGNRCRVLVNGTTTSDVTDPNLPAGSHPIVFICAPGSSFRLKDIGIHELPPVDEKLDTPPTAVVPALDPKMTALFNGKDLTNWEAVGNTNAQWTITDGILKGSWKNSDFVGGSTLATKRKDYRNFRLRVVAKPVENWACRIHALPGINPQGVNGYFKAWIGTNPVSVGGETGRLTMRDNEDAPLLAQPELKADEWFVYELIVEGNRIQTIVNGTKTADQTDDRLPQAGHSIGLHLTGGSVWHIKSVEIEELKAERIRNDYDALATGKWQSALTANADIVRRNATISNGLIEVQNGHAYDKSVKATDLIVRAKVQKLSGQNVLITLRDELGVYYSAFYENDGVEQFGIGMRGVRFVYSIKQRFAGAAPVREGEFFELAFSAVGDTLTVYVNGKRIGSMRDTAISRAGGVAVHTTKGKGVFKEVEYISLDRMK